MAVNLLRCTDYSFEDPHQFAILDIIEVSRRNAPEREALRTYEVDVFYWTVLAPDIVNPGREEQGSFSV